MNKKVEKFTKKFLFTWTTLARRKIFFLFRRLKNLHSKGSKLLINPYTTYEKSTFEQIVNSTLIDNKIDNGRDSIHYLLIFVKGYGRILVSTKQESESCADEDSKVNENKATEVTY